MQNVSLAVTSAYLDLLGREPDAGGLVNYYDSIVRDGMTVEAMREHIYLYIIYAIICIRNAASNEITSCIACI